MKARRSFVKRNAIAILLLVIIASISGMKTLQKEMKHREFLKKEQVYLKDIEELKKTLVEKTFNLENVNNLEFVEKYARENLNMIKTNEFLYIIAFPKDSEEDKK